MNRAHVLGAADHGVSSMAVSGSRSGFTGPPSLMRLTSQSKSPAPVPSVERQVAFAQEDGDDWKDRDVDELGSKDRDEPEIS